MTNCLSELERLEREATPGPWEDGTATCCPDMGWVDGPKGKGRVCPVHESTKRTHTIGAEDAALIAAARNALPALLRIARAAEAVLGADVFAPDLVDWAEVRELRAALAAFESGPSKWAPCREVGRDDHG